MDEALSCTQELLLAGARIVQLRAKGFAPAELESLAASMQALCTSQRALFVLNDHSELAAHLQLDALHLGQEDGCIHLAREQLGPGAIIGRSTHSLEQARQAKAEGADYIGFGPLFATNTKPGRPAIGLAELATAQSSVGKQLPLFAIGGINSSNLQRVLAAGAERVCIVSDILQAADTQEHTRGLLLSLKNQGPS